MPQRPFEPCIPTRATRVPASKFWIHEVKHDGYRLIVQRDGKTVRLFSRNGHDLTRRYPWVAEAALQNRQQRFVIDGEAVILGVDGVSDFNALHSRQQDHEVQLYAFDILSLDGDDLRKLPLIMRKTNLARLLGRRPDGIFIAPFETGEIGPDLFRKACEFGLEGLVSSLFKSRVLKPDGWNRPLHRLQRGTLPERLRNRKANRPTMANGLIEPQRCRRD
jgi:bifunctional non-homologous end joining protein LigD